MFGAIQISPHPLHVYGRRKNQVHLQVLSTLPALPYRTNCLDIFNVAAQKTASHRTNELLEDKLGILRVGATGNVYISGRLHIQSG